jgi:NADH dehydrogenase FAD-containing subunit
MHSTSEATIILGGGFTGLLTALHLQRQKYAAPVILINPHDRFVFKPLLYELLTDEIHAEQICVPYQKLLTDNTKFIKDAVDAIDLPNRQIVLSTGRKHKYRNLVISLGGKTNYFNTTGAARHTFPFTSDLEAITLKQHLIDCLAKARTIHDPAVRQARLTVAIIGAGPAGVELACTLADILPTWYDRMGGDYDRIRVVLMNRGDEILKGDINSRLRQIAQTALDQRTIPVEKRFEITIQEITPHGVEYVHQDQSHFLPAATVIWTAGTQPSHLLNTLAIADSQRDRSGRLNVTPTLQLADFPEVFVGGDCAHVSHNPQPATAQVAYQQGKIIAQNLIKLASGQPPQPAQVNLRGTLLKLGMAEGAASLCDRVELAGDIGRLIRQIAYLELLPAPSHNFHQTAEWLTDEVLQRHQVRSLNPRHHGKTPFLTGVVATAASLMLAIPFAWRAIQPQQFHDQLAWTGVPTLLNQLASK